MSSYKLLIAAGQRFSVYLFHPLVMKGFRFLTRSVQDGGRHSDGTRRLGNVGGSVMAKHKTSLRSMMSASFDPEHTKTFTFFFQVKTPKTSRLYSLGSLTSRNVVFMFALCLNALMSYAKKHLNGLCLQKCAAQ